MRHKGTVHPDEYNVMLNFQIYGQLGNQVK